MGISAIFNTARTSLAFERFIDNGLIVKQAHKIYTLWQACKCPTLEKTLRVLVFLGLNELLVLDYTQSI
jgi:hypothetical protein